MPYNRIINCVECVVKNKTFPSFLPQVARLLLDHNCEVDALSMGQNDAKTPLIQAVEFDNVGIIDLLIEAGADMDVGDHYGVTSLISAIFKSNTRVVVRLIRANCDINKTSANGLSPLEAALMRSELNIVKILLTAGCRVRTSELVELEKLDRDTVSVKDMEEIFSLVHCASRLLQLCRKAIIRNLGCLPSYKIKRLPLPVNLRNYLMFPEFEEKRLYPFEVE